MARRRYSISASDNAPIPVLACFDKQTGPTKKTYLSVLACNSCKTEIMGNNFKVPYCPCCASDDVSPTSDKLMPHTDKEISEMVPVALCEDCNTQIASPKESLASLDDHAIYCPACSSMAKAIVADDSDEEDSDVSEDDDSDTSSDSDTDMSDTVDDDSDELFNNDENEGGDTDTSSDDTSSDDTTSDSTDTDTSTDDTSTDTGSSLNANLVKAMSGKGDSTSVVASPDRSKWYLFVDNVPVATASKDSASDNVQGMFNTDKFVTAWEAATSDGVTEDTLSDFGFTAINTSVPVDEAVKQTVEAAIEEGTKKFNVTAKDVADRLTRCVGIAAVGINKNVFNEENPVRTALIASLQPRKVRDAKRLVEAAFEQYGEQYLKNIVLKASELMEKSDETLDNLAETVDEAKYDKNSEEPVKPSVVSLFPNKEEEEDVKVAAKPVEIAASDNVDINRYANILGGASLRA